MSIYKFAVHSTKLGNAKIVNIRAKTFEDAVSKLRSDRPKLFLTYTVLIAPFHQVIENFDFDYEGEVYKNWLLTW
jgi:hypothetical protein